MSNAAELASRATPGGSPRQFASSTGQRSLSETTHSTDDAPRNQRRDNDQTDREPTEPNLPPTGLSRAAALDDQGIDDTKHRTNVSRLLQSCTRNLGRGSL